MSFRHIDLFAGIGGFSRAVDWLGGETVAFVEWDSWCRRVLAKHWPDRRFFGDIHAVSTDDLHALGPIDLITGGYPCQPFSVAGKRLGHDDHRHLWPEMRRVINTVRPRLVLAENVDGHVNMGLDTVLSDLEADGYACGAVVVPAASVNALHKRNRVWIMAHAEGGTRIPAAHGGSGREGGAARLEAAGSGGGFAGPGTSAVLGNPEVERVEGMRGSHHENRPGLERQAVPVRADGDAGEGSGEQVAWPLDAGPDGLRPGLVRRPATGPAEPDLIRQAWADGSWELDLPRVVAEEPERRQKLQGAGNAIVPIVAYEILKVMLKGEV